MPAKHASVAEPDPTIANLPLQDTARSIGNRLRELRKAQGMTLVELARRTNVDIATISRIETGKMTGTIESHVKLAAALGVKLIDLYSGIEEARVKDSVSVQNAGQRRDVYVHEPGQTSMVLLTADVFKKKMMPALISLDPGGRTQDEENKVGTEKFLLVLDGALEAHVGGKTYPLRKGSSLYFDASVSHWLENSGKRPAKCVAVATPPAL